MHLSDAVLATSDAGRIVLGAGMVLAAGATAVGLRKMDYERMPRVAVLSSAFFVASLIHVEPFGVSIHLVLNGLMGLILGWAAVPAILVALLLQAALFQFGGLLAVGVNTLVMGLPAVVCYYLFHRGVRDPRKGVALAVAVAAAVTAVMLASLLCALALHLSGENLAGLGRLVLLANLPVAAIDAMVTASVVMFLRQVSPEVLDALPAIPVPGETPHACAHDS